MFDSMDADQRSLFDSLDRYLKRAATRRRGHEPPEGRGPDWDEFARMGLLEIGASGPSERPGDPEMLAIVANLLGYHGVRSSFQSTAVVANVLLKSAQDPSTREKLLDAVAAGAVRVALAHAESQSDYVLHDVNTRATPTRDGWQISGRKIVVIDGDADLLVVSARTSGEPDDQRGLTMFVVDPAEVGVERRRYRSIDGAFCADVALDNVLVGSDMLIGEVDQGYEVLARAADQVSVTMCAEAVGAMEAIFEQTLEYLKLREQFGVRLGSFQVLQHRLVDMLVMLEQARSLTWAAAKDLNCGDDPRLIPAAKLKCIESGRMIGEAGIQTHGGMGMTDEIEIGHLYKRILAIEHSYGDRRFQLRRLRAMTQYSDN